jgi:hypothetical protein
MKSSEEGHVDDVRPIELNSRCALNGAKNPGYPRVDVAEIDRRRRRIDGRVARTIVTPANVEFANEGRALARRARSRRAVS